MQTRLRLACWVQTCVSMISSIGINIAFTCSSVLVNDSNPWSKKRMGVIWMKAGRRGGGGVSSRRSRRRSGTESVYDRSPTLDYKRFG